MQLLRDVEKNEPKLWKELQKEPQDADYIGKDEADLFAGEVSADGLDDSAVPVEIIRAQLLSSPESLPKGFIRDDDGSIAPYSALEVLDFDSEMADGDLIMEGGSDEVVGCIPKRQKLA